MVTKGIIKSIDFNGNTCTVRLPLFETAATAEPIVTTAIFSNTPGAYNGYKEEDVVLVAFEDNKVESPVIIGKLYLGASKEKADDRGSILCENLTATEEVSIPITTKLTLDNDAKNLTQVGVDNDLSTYKSIADIAKSLQKQESQIGAINVKIIDDGENLGARLTKVENDNIIQQAEIIANAEGISSEVSRAEQAESGLSEDISLVDQKADHISATVVHRVDSADESGGEDGLGWNLTTDNWTLNKIKDGVTSEILKADENGLTVTGTIKADAGEIAGFTIEENRLTSGSGAHRISIQSNGDTFTVGNDIYTKIEYIESHGQEYINTGVTTNAASISKIEAHIYKTSSSGTANILFGLYEPADPGQQFALPALFYIDYATASTQVHQCAVGSTNSNRLLKTNISNGAGDKEISYVLTSDPGSIVLPTITYTVNENSASTIALFGGTNTLPYFLFTRNNNGVADSTAFYSCKLYSFKIWGSNDTLIRDFIPVIKNNIECGLFDSVTNTFYGNASGSGAFTGDEFNSIYLGSDDGETAPFRVTNTGKLFATDANISGTVNATDGNFTGNIEAQSGYIGGFTIENTQLSANTTDNTVIVSPELIWLQNETTQNKVLLTKDGQLQANNAEISGEIAADALSLQGVPFNIYGVKLSGEEEHYSAEYTWSETGSYPSYHGICNIKILCKNPSNVATPVAANRQINVTIAFAYAAAMGGGDDIHIVTTNIIIPAGQSESPLTTIQDTYSSRVFRENSSYVIISPTSYISKQGNFKNEYGYFLDKNTCFSKQYILNFKELDSGINILSCTFSLARISSSGSSGVYSAVNFDVGRFVSKDFDEIWGVSAHIISKNSSLAVYDEHTAEELAAFNTPVVFWTNPGTILGTDQATIKAKDATFDGGLMAGFYDSQQRDVRYNFKTFGGNPIYNAANAIWEGMVLLVYGTPKIPNN